MRVILLLSVLLATDLTIANDCDINTAIVQFKKPFYDFSRKILDSVSLSTDGHFVFSPILTWMQLTNIAEGAQGRTLKELLAVTGMNRRTCTRVVIRKILNEVNEEVKTAFKSQSLVIVDTFLNVKRNFKKRLQLSNTTSVESLNFLDPYESARIANEILSQRLGENVDVVDPTDFQYTTLLMADVAYFSSAWLKPFLPLHTTKELFHYERYSRQVDMMSQTNYFKLIKVDVIDAHVLELPCLDERHSMLIFLPIRRNIKDLFLFLQEVRLSTLFNLFKKVGDTIVNVKIPKFTITTDLGNIPELVHDMGVTEVFDTERAKLRGVSDYKINLSDMRQNVKIEVNEEGVSGIAESIFQHDTATSDFIANRPFAFMLVDKPTEIILFAGVYSEPCKAGQC